ncbi:MAG: methyltransferase domain-containing protein [Chloroflexi bacterium]|nr:methyltransferase domain-containing protein [Chloroflexota bacterium]
MSSSRCETRGTGTMYSSHGTAPADWSEAALLAQLYDWEHDGFRDDIALYSALGRRTGGSVLELACGTGRILAGLVDDGFHVVGVDRSPDMLERARVRLAHARGAAELVLADMREGVLPGTHGLIVFGLDAFGLVHDPVQQTDTLDRVRAALQGDGVVVLDLVHVGSLADHPHGIPVLQRSGADEEIDANVTKWMVLELHPAAQLIEWRCFYDISWRPGGFRRVTETVEIRTFGRYEIELLLARAGLRVEAMYGDYELGPFQDDSRRMLVVARRHDG